MRKVCNELFWIQRIMDIFHFNPKYDKLRSRSPPAKGKRIVPCGDDDPILPMGGPKGKSYYQFYQELIQIPKDKLWSESAKRGYLGFIKVLLEEGTNIHALDDYALRYAAQKDHLPVVKYLVEKGANIHADNDYALRVAASYGHLPVVKYLVEAGADIHAENDEALRFAKKYKHKDVVQYLKEVMAKESSHIPLNNTTDNQ